ncbi:MAG: hypothetical protein KME17_25250 [Cyanosarcina radialis HA8281-LM2]|jgi:hypothetical protein|nr:hypothetical protein [Cyanosarcina radialis HA8281-LM2]
MQTYPNLSRTYSLLASPRARRFLIPPYERFKFILLFALLTAFGWLLAAYLGTEVRNLIFTPQLPSPLTPFDITIPGGALGGAFIQFTVFGTVLGTAQWLILRQYVPTWKWIGATIVSWIAIGLVGEILFLSFKDTSAIGAISNFLSYFQPWSFMLLQAVGTIPLIAVGVAQWFVLRQYVRAANWWILIPPISVIFWSFYAFAIGQLLSWLGAISGPSPYSHDIFRGAILGSVQAIALCAFRQQNSNPKASNINELDSPLNSAPEITNWQQVRFLSRKLYQQINSAWKGEIKPADNLELKATQNLIYLVGVAENGAILTYQPVNQAASDYQHLTPLPDLVYRPRSQSEEPIDRTPLARFQVIMTPAGSLEIRDWGGKPLLAVALGAIAIVTVAGVAMTCIESNLPQSWLSTQSDRNQT